MKKVTYLSFLFSLLVLFSMSSFAETEAKTATKLDGSLKIKEFIKDFDIKISKKELLGMIDTLAKSGKISKNDAEKARKEISAMSDDQFEASTKKALKSIPDNMTIDDAQDSVKAVEKMQSKP